MSIQIAIFSGFLLGFDSIKNIGITPESKIYTIVGNRVVDPMHTGR